MTPRWALLLGLCPLAAGAHAGDGVHVHGLLGVGARWVDAETFAGLSPGVVFESDDDRIVLEAPLFVSVSRSPGLRSADWDERTDWGRVIAEVALEGRGGGWWLEAGRTTLPRLGHGTLVSEVIPYFDPDHAHTGLHAGVQTRAARFELVAGEILALELLAARFSLAPLALGEGDPDGWHLGITVAADATAPSRLTGGVTTVRLPESERAPVAHVAFDTDVVVHRGPGFALAPYADAVVAAAGPARGRGALHLGLLADVGPAEGVTAAVKLEARWFGAGYVPEHYDAYYALERWEWPLERGGPKAAADTPGSWGARVEVSLRLGEGALLALSADGRRLGPANAAAHLALEDLAGLDVSVHLAHRGFDGWRQALDDGGWILVSEARYAFGELVSVSASAARVYRVELVTAAYRPAWDVGMGAVVAF